MRFPRNSRGGRARLRDSATLRSQQAGSVVIETPTNATTLVPDRRSRSGSLLPTPAPQRLQLVRLRRAGYHCELRERIRYRGSLRDLRKRSGDAGEGDERQFGLGRRFPIGRIYSADAGDGTAGFSTYGLAAAFECFGGILPASALGPGAALERSLYVGRHRNRVSKRAPAGLRNRGGICGTHAWRGRSPCSTIRRRCWACA